ncbi:hypothetical protein [Amycolatopsis sp. cmx-11-12]|uniref:hypothetical protein n=1 Tax=Amycolatopsis sp. cmx-11-12 TaxID=2785795 RepID=UPI003917D755
MLTKTIGSALLVTAMVSPAAAWAGPAPGPGGCQSSGVRGTCWVGATDPGRPGREGGQPGTGPASPGKRSGPAPQCVPMAIPQPASGDPMWAGNDASKGRLVVMICGVGGPGGGYPGDARVAYVPNGSEPPAVPQVSPAELARQAIDQMGLSAPDIRLAPPADSPHGATIGFPVWMWSARSDATTGPVTRTATAGTVSVTATAKLTRITWSMGDGATKACAGPGTPFTEDRAGLASPDCGHVYLTKAPSGAFPIAATGHWEISWSGGGMSDSEAMDLTSSARLPVREIRTLNSGEDGHE